MSSVPPPPAPGSPATFAVPDLLGLLRGRWQLTRTTRDLVNGMTGHFTGTAEFSPLPATGENGETTGTTGTGETAGTAGRRSAGAGLLHHESGSFEWGGVERPATRTLRWLPGAGGPGTARVEFEDGRFFHDLDLRAGHAVADHPCSLDLYRGEFTVTGPDRWTVVWRVAGPAKDLVLSSEHRRIP